MAGLVPAIHVLLCPKKGVDAPHEAGHDGGETGVDQSTFLFGGDGRESAMDKPTRFDAADYLNSEQRQASYIAAALETGEADFVRDALGLVARARGMRANEDKDYD